MNCLTLSLRGGTLKWSLNASFRRTRSGDGTQGAVMPKKSSPPRAESESTNWRKLESTNWRKLYRAAILELNPSKLLQHIAKAEKALVQRARELFQSAGDNAEEAEALDDAMSALHAFRSTLKC